MKKLIITLLLILITVPVSYAQTAENREKVYKQALAYNDLTVATQAVYDILAMGPKYENWRDTLAVLYFQRGGFDQCRRIAGAVLQDHPEKIEMMELLAVSEQSTGQFKNAIESYSKLYEKTKNIFHLYEITTLHYSLKQYDEAEKMVSKLLSDPAIENEKINLNTGPNQMQDVILRAAVYNLQGVLALEKGDKAKARQAFNAAIKIDGDFALPANNIDFMDKQEKEEKEMKSGK